MILLKYQVNTNEIEYSKTARDKEKQQNENKLNKQTIPVQA